MTADVLVYETKKLQAAFPSLPPSFFQVLANRIKEHKFSNERLTDAVNNLVDNFIFPTPAIANIISFDKRVTLYSYNDVLLELDKGKCFADFVKVRKQGFEKPFYITNAEKVKFNIPDEL